APGQGMTDMARAPRTSSPHWRGPATARLVWRRATCRVRHTRDYLAPGTDHIEIEVLSPKGAPLPITGTGYRSHFLDAAELAAAGGTVAYVTAWLDREAKTKAWAKAEFLWRQ